MVQVNPAQEQDTLAMDILLAILILLYIASRVFRGNGKGGFFGSLILPVWNFIWRTAVTFFRYTLQILKQVILFAGMVFWKFLKWAVWFIYELARFIFHAVVRFFRSFGG